MTKYADIVEKLKDQITLFSVQIPSAFERSKKVKVGGIYKGHAVYIDPDIPEKLIEVTLEDGTSNFNVVTIEKEFLAAINKLNISVGDLIVCDGIMTDRINGDKIIITTSVEKL